MPRYTHWDLMDLQLAMQVDGGKYNFLFGRDEYLMAAVALGVEGLTCNTFPTRAFSVSFSSPFSNFFFALRRGWFYLQLQRGYDE